MINAFPKSAPCGRGETRNRTASRRPATNLACPPNPTGVGARPWSLRGRNSRLPQDRRSGLARASAARRARRAAHRMCAVQFALISTICPSFSLNMTRTSKQELKMHAQAEPERPKGEGHGWPEFYSPQMRGKWWSDIEFSLSRLSTAQTPCLARRRSRRRRRRVDQPGFVFLNFNRILPFGKAASTTSSRTQPHPPLPRKRRNQDSGHRTTQAGPRRPVPRCAAPRIARPAGTHRRCQARWDSRPAS